MKKLITILLSSVFISGCVTQPIQQKSSLELQAIQVREFETTQKTAFNSVLSVFQDLGYIVSSASIESGFITAKSPTNKEFVMFVGQRMTEEKANAFIEQVGSNRTKIRLSFVQSEVTSGNGMRGEKETPVQDAAAYRETFTKIQQSIFIRSNVN